MSHSAEGITFLTRLNAISDEPGVKLDDVLQPSLDDEHELRKLFAQDKNNSRLKNPYVGLVDVFGPHTDALRKTRARLVDYDDEESLSGKYVMSLKENERRKGGEAATVVNLEKFKKNWSIFTEGSLSQLLDWNNVIAAGGSVLSALLPLAEEDKKSKRAVRKYYHSTAFPSSDVDLFLWGLTPEQAEKKIITIYEAVRDSVPWDVTCIRTKHTISIHSQYPYRSVQIVLRLYQSPAEVLAGFDIDAPCCAYDGERVWANPRALIAMIRQCNTIDVTRRSPSYEVRLAKYAKRGFEVYVPNLKRQDVDPTIYERSIVKIEGLARLLVLEKLQDFNARYDFLESRRQLRGRPYPLRHPASKKKHHYKGDLKTGIGGLEMNDYDVVSLHIPYGPGWDAKRIDKLVYQTDLGMNSTFNPKNKGRRLHRHPAFFGSIEECIEDCCEHCPEPIDEDERNLQAEEDKKFIRGRISFIEENPGRQTLSGSFNPIDEGEWSEQVYMRPLQKLFNAIVAHDIALVRSLLEENKTTNAIDLANRDHVGRTALHLAILVKDEEIAKLLVDEGCRMIARIVDGRTALHMAAQYGLDSLIKKMFEKSKANKEEAEKKTKEAGKDSVDGDEEMKDGTTPPPDTTTEPERPSSEDDWSSDENDGKIDSMDVDDDGGDADDEEGVDENEYDDCKDDNDDEPGNGKKKDEAQDTHPAEEEDNEEDPDVLDVNAGDWDQGFTPLCYAVLYSTRSTVDILLQNGADPNQAAIPSSNSSWQHAPNLLPLYFTLLRSESDEDISVSIAERLIEGGAAASTANEGLMTILHYAALAQRPKVLDTLLKKDPGAKKALDFPSVQHGKSKFPITTAIGKGAYASLLTLLAHGANINPTGADVSRAKAISTTNHMSIWGYGIQDYSKQIYMPVEAALAEGDYIVDVLFENGAEVNVGIHNALSQYCTDDDRKTILDWVVKALETELPKKIKEIKKELEEKVEISYTPPTEKPKTWKEYLDDIRAQYITSSNKNSFDLIATQENALVFLERQRKEKLDELAQREKALEFFQNVRNTLESLGAKTWGQIYPSSDEDGTKKLMTHAMPVFIDTSIEGPKSRYMLFTPRFRKDWVPHEQSERYDELFEAAYKGDDAKIERLCVPASEDADMNAIPVRVTVEAVFDTGSSRGSYENGIGLTPLHAAIAGKRWNTAKLIMGIAAAQYRSDEDENEMQAKLFELVDEEDGEDSDASDNESIYSDVTVDARKHQTKFVNIAKKISIRTDIHPSKLLTNPSWVLDGKTVKLPLILKAIKENNFEAFIHVFNIQESLDPKQVTSVDSILGTILGVDSPKFLDELIRRTGVGIDIDTVCQTSGDDHPVVLNDENRLYLGLNIHGKKRADLARKGDPNATQSDEFSTPLVWQAIFAGAKSSVEYLASNAPIAAYKHFAANGKGVKAEWLRHSKNLETSLNDWLGWRGTEIGENPLVVAVLGDRKEMLSLLFSKNAKLVGPALHTKVKFLGFNLLLIAANRGCSKDIFEFLLKKGVSPLEVDSLDRWNIYHWLCALNKRKVVEFLLEFLPREVSEELLAGRTKEKQRTPLHIAVNNGNLSLVEVITKFSQKDILAYDARGFTPFHYAIKHGYVGITEILIKAIPQDGLYLENGVGKTPYEDAEKRAMQPITNSIDIITPSTLGNAGIHIRENIEEMEKELQRVIEVLKLLISNGTIEKGATLSNSFEKFVSASEGRLAKLKAQKATAKAEEAEKEKEKEKRGVVREDPQDKRNAILTFRAIGKAVGSNAANRILIHLKDVQKSVAVDLDRVNQTKEVAREVDGLEEDDKKDNKMYGMVHSKFIKAFDLW